LRHKNYLIVLYRQSCDELEPGNLFSVMRFLLKPGRFEPMKAQGSSWWVASSNLERVYASSGLAFGRKIAFTHD
jgi:hypothetical protein